MTVSAKIQGVRRLASLLIALALTLGAAACGGSEAAAPTSSTVNNITRCTGFRDARHLDDHFAKHGREFGDISKATYLVRAMVLCGAPVGGDVLEIERSDGVISRFDRSTGAFIAFEDDGTIRTFFRPRDGERYFRRQAGRSH